MKMGPHKYNNHTKSRVLIGFKHIHRNILRFDVPSNSISGMMTSSNGNIFRLTDPLCGEFTGPDEFPTQRPVTRSFGVFFDLRLNKRLSKQPRCWWFETLLWSLWRHCNEPISLTLFNLNSHSTDISISFRPDYDKMITIKFCTWCGSCDLVASLNIGRGLMPSNRIAGKTIVI